MSFTLQHHYQQVTMLTNNQIIGDAVAALLGDDTSATTQENKCIKRATEMWWRDQTLNINTINENTVVKALDCSLGDPPEVLHSDPQDGQLPHHVLLSISQLQDESNTCDFAQCVTVKKDPGFKKSSLAWKANRCKLEGEIDCW